MKIINLNEVNKRKPVLDSDSIKKYNLHTISKQWLVLTENIRRDLLKNPQMRKALLELIDAKVSEKLPIELLSKLEDESKVTKLTEKFSDQIVSFLSLDAVEDDQINIDVSNAKRLVTPEEMYDRLVLLYGLDSDEVYKKFHEHVDSDTFSNGITYAEKTMILKRYSLARDVKLLAFQAEFIENKSLIENSSNEISLPSGTHINYHIPDNKLKAEILNPENWKNRRELKDRVYEITIGDKLYVLKEKKTNRHRDTMKGGHFDGLTSVDEYKTAKFFKENCVLEKEFIKLNWETPIASVTFPDGFQFVIYDHEKEFIPECNVLSTLYFEILKRKEIFQEEYSIIKNKCLNLMESPKVENYQDVTLKDKILGLFGLKDNGLSFDDFCKVKALMLYRTSKNFLEETVIKNGYKNRDRFGYGFKINSSEKGSFQLEIFGYDFEYYEPLEEDEKISRVKDLNDYQNSFDYQNGIFLKEWSNGLGEVTKVQQAAYLTMYELNKKS